MKSQPTSKATLPGFAILLVGMLAGSPPAIRLAGAQTTSQTASQSIPQSIVGSWQADAPLPNGVIQTFHFDPDGGFDLTKALSVDGTYQVDGNRLIETVTLPSVGVTHTDTATFSAVGDSLVVSESAGSAPRVLHRTGSATGGSVGQSGIVGDWTIQVGTEIAARYSFEPGGEVHVRARVGDERGKYVVHADTLHLSNDQSFEIPAIARFAITDSVLTLTPPSGNQPRRFHRVSPR